MKVFVTLGPVSAAHIDDIVSLGPLAFRLTFSFGTTALQISRATQIQTSSSTAKIQTPVWGALSGASDRIGRLLRGEFETELPVSVGKIVEVIDADKVDFDTIIALPIPGIKSKKLKAGDRFIYGDHQCEFVIDSVLNGKVFVRAMATTEVIGTRSIYFPKRPARKMSLDGKALEQIEVIFKNPELFAGIIIPDFVDFSSIAHIDKLRKAAGAKTAIASSIERGIEQSSFQSALAVSEFVILDRAKISLNDGTENMPKIVDKYIQNSGEFRHKILVASHIATNISQGRRPTLSSAELSDLANIRKLGIGGIVLTEETAVDPDFLLAIRSTKQHLTPSS